MSTFRKSPHHWGASTLERGVLEIHDSATQRQFMALFADLLDEHDNRNGNFEVTDVIVRAPCLAQMVWASLVISPLRSSIRTFKVCGVNSDSPFAISPQTQKMCQNRRINDCEHIEVFHICG